MHAAGRCEFDEQRKKAPYLFQIHSLHRRIHALYHIRHAARDLAHRYCRLDSAADGIKA